VLLQAKAPESKQSAGMALRRRDAWLARHAHEAVVVWDGEDAAVGSQVRSLRDHLGEEDVWVVEPHG
jgi:polyphosphate kinase 2 (PPK2 family)